ncbi:GNAT family N-acetyltransferase [Cohnella sp. CBP 2801]|uniref:GNAT family N-acetyltransferase n=1 Tax=Cohnella zeiphila TaxID=2761120 RepID=A0A7X0SLH2_9BACL|nr:GNAT family N-acetyltransferase [Cohnella zeiphila]MBB6729918.1 GNAT family N-acetyltransferase [Cohnella zeiphila]
MLKDIKGELDQPEVTELLEASMFPDPDIVRMALDAYRNDPALELLGYYEGEELVGAIGFRMKTGNVLEIRHMAVSPEKRGHGHGRLMVLETLARKNPAELVAETDEEAVEFYRNIGFVVESLGELYPGVERFRCRYIVNPEAED